MNKLKATTKIRCNTCGCTMRRTKTIEVISTEKDEAILEANKKIDDWQKTLEGQNCSTCESIIQAVRAENTGEGEKPSPVTFNPEFFPLPTFCATCSARHGCKTVCAAFRKQKLCNECPFIRGCKKECGIRRAIK